MSKFIEYSRFIKPKRRVTKVYLHCSAHDGEKTDNAATMDRWHKDRGWRGIGYHFFIRFDGTIEHGRSITRIPAAQARHNRGSIAICCHGGQNSKPDAFTEDQFDSLRKICTDIDKAYKGKITFHGHKEVSAKACPVYDYKSILGLDKNGYLKKGAVSEDKLVSAGSKTIKAAKSNKDAGGAVIGVGVVGSAKPALEIAKNYTNKTSEWRSVLDTAIDALAWGLNHWPIALIAVGAILYWNNRSIIKSRIKDELKIGRLNNEPSS